MSIIVDRGGGYYYYSTSDGTEDANGRNGRWRGLGGGTAALHNGMAVLKRVSIATLSRLV